MRNWEHKALHGLLKAIVFALVTLLTIVYLGGAFGLTYSFPTTQPVQTYALAVVGLLVAELLWAIGLYFKRELGRR